MPKKTEKKWLRGFAGAWHISEPIPDLFKKGRWATIDPGDNTAVAIWYNGVCMLSRTYHMSLNTPPDLIMPCTSVVIENVELWGGSSVSYASASSGDLFKLAFETGALIYEQRRQGNDVYIVSPRKWKGQLDYDQLRHILYYRFHMQTRNEHEASARGIGLWALRQF
jgi:hypothetical protein